ncbi:MAG: hypothetical protein R6U96_10690 [Promethearchaeia archaeon]
MENEEYISLRSFFSEKIIRNLVLFSFLFLLTIAQGYLNILLLLFPLISFGFSLTFSIIGTNKYLTEFTKSYVNYNPLGAESKHADRLNFCALFQLIVLFWYGAESLYHPQLVDNYYLYFMILFIFLYTLGFYWIFIDLWKYSKIEIVLHDIDFSGREWDSDEMAEKLDYLLSYLKLDEFRSISTWSFVIFLTCNLGNLLFSFFVHFNILEGFAYNLPGTGLENSAPISLSYFLILILILPPVFALVLFRKSYQTINALKPERLNELLAPLPKNVQFKIIENLRLLQKNIDRQNDFE